LEDHKGNPQLNLWERAAIVADSALRAAEGVRTLDGERYHELVKWDETNPDNPDKYGNRGYYYIFKGNVREHLKREVIFGRRGQTTWNAQGYIHTIRPPGQLKGLYGVAPNQLLVDCFEMQDTGLPIDATGSGYREQDPYTGRDPRFYHNIMYNGCEIMNRTLKIWNSDQATGAFGSEDLEMERTRILPGFTLTGTYARKWMGQVFEETNFDQCWSYIRMPELYMNFAEAANEAWNSPTVRDGRCLYTAEEAINIVRRRALMPGIQNRYLNQNDFRDRMLNERRVEFCWEEHRLFDVRRRKIGSLPVNRDFYKVNITRLASATAEYPTGFKFEREPLAIRTFYSDRHDLFVIPVGDTRLGPNFNQNPGW
jgi:hypothetical protein